MTLHTGSNQVSKLYVGNNEVQKVYVGNTEVYSNSATPPVDPPPVGGDGGDFSVSYYPTNPIEGEAVVFYVTNTSGWSNVTDEYIEIDFKWDFGDSGATYTVGGGGRDDNANYAEGRVVAHTWEGSGTKDITVIAYKADGTSTGQTISVSVRAENSIAWDHDVYVSQSGNFSGFPAAGGAVSHVTGWNALSNFSFGSNSNCRITFRDDETFLVTNGNEVDINTSSNLYYIRRSGAGTNPPIISANGSAGQRFRAFDVANSGARVIFNEIDAEGGWDPVQLTAANGLMVFCRHSVPGPGVSPSVSYHKCTARGLETFHSGQGNESHSGTVYLRMTDCNIGGWYNYGALGHFGGNLIGGTAGCRVVQNPLAINIADGKVFLEGTGADHGPFRLHYPEYWCNENNTVRSANGWSTLNPTSATQPCFRYHTLNTANVRPDWVVNCRRNACVGDANMVGYGSQSDAKPAIVPGHCIVAGNSFDGGKQGFFGFASTWGLSGLRIFNNVLVRHNLYERGNGTNDRNIALYTFKSPDSPASAMTAFSFLGFNTFVSLRDTGVQSTTTNWETIRQDVSRPYTGTPFTERGNIIHCPDLGNGGSFPSYTLSPDEDFRLVTGSANGLGAISSGIVPGLDYGGIQRSSTSTNVGAHHTEAALVSTPPTPSISGPVISQIVSLGSSPSKYALTGFGTVSNVISGIFDIQWIVNGSNVSGNESQIEVYDDAANGALTAQVTITNRSGTRAIATSNSVSI